MTTTWARNDYAKSTELVAVGDRLGALTDPATGSVNARLEEIRAAVAPLAAALDGVETLLTSLGANTDQVETLLTALNGFVDGLETLLSSTLSVESGNEQIASEVTAAAIRDGLGRTVERTAFTYTDGLLTGYTEDGVAWTITRNPDGTIASVTSA